MPNRILKESINESKALAEVSIFAEDLYKRLITYADDYGRFSVDSQIMLARLYPREIQIVSISDIEDALQDLSAAQKIAFYTDTEKKHLYGVFPRWSDHQRIRDTKEKYPEPQDYSVNEYYSKRAVPMQLKIEILERDNFKCSKCGKYITTETNAYRFAKMCAGAFHFDYKVPLENGGEVNDKNLKLICPKCNALKKRLNFDDLLKLIDEPQKDVTNVNSRRLAATCGELPPESESESESEYIISADTEPKKEKQATDEKEQAIFEIPTNTGEGYPFFQADIDLYKSLYPSVDIAQEMRKMVGWSDANPTKRKTKVGMKRFVNAWLSREQDKYKPASASATKPAGTKFNNFEQRNDDIDADMQKAFMEQLKGVASG